MVPFFFPFSGFASFWADPDTRSEPDSPTTCVIFVAFSALGLFPLFFFFFFGQPEHTQCGPRRFCSEISKEPLILIAPLEIFRTPSFISVAKSCCRTSRAYWASALDGHSRRQYQRMRSCHWGCSTIRKYCEVIPLCGLLGSTTFWTRICWQNHCQLCSKCQDGGN